jgi:hypothetical protein
MSKIIALLFTLILFCGCASAVISVEDLYNQGAQNTAAMNELKASFESFKTNLIDQINLIKLTTVFSFAGIYVAIHCFFYLGKEIYTYINRKRLGRERDKFCDNLKRENSMVKERLGLYDIEIKIMRENYYLIKELMNKNLKAEVKTKNYSWLNYFGVLTVLCGTALLYYHYTTEGCFLFGMALISVYVGFTSILDNKKSRIPEPEMVNLKDKLEQLKEGS